jgi:peptide-O-fucosyltransferase
MLALARELDRTLVLPPFIEYHGSMRRLVPFEELFEVEPLRRYTSVLTIAEYKRTVVRERLEEAVESICPEASIESAGTNAGYCKLRSGQPSTDFWDDALGAGRNPVRSHAFDPSILSLDKSKATGPDKPSQWKETFAKEQHPVLLFAALPVPYPVLSKHRTLQNLLIWTKPIRERAAKLIESLGHKWIAVHFRHGSDWKISCDMAEDKKKWMSSGQCGTDVSRRMCIPDVKEAVEDIAKEARRTGARNVFVASDDRKALDEMRVELKARDLELVMLAEPDIYVDLAVMSSPKAAHFIGNCVSSFTAFVKRRRDVDGTPSSFFGD